jgi:hypothetical protein
MAAAATGSLGGRPYPLGLRLAFCLLALVVALPAWAQETAGERIDRILEQGRYQRELPADPEPVVPEQRRMADNRPSEPFELDLTLLFWALAAATAVVLLFHLALRLRPGSGMAADDGAIPADEAPVLPAGPLADADQLAAAGAWAEAMHLLLLHVVEALKRRLGPVPPALTSRELMRRIQLPEPATAAFAAIVAAVERSHFGGKPVGAADYHACRGHYQAFKDNAAGPATGSVAAGSAAAGSTA